MKSKPNGTNELRKTIKVTATDRFTLICLFDNGITKEFDMNTVLSKSGPMIQPLQDLIFFKKVFIEMGTPTWPNGFDLCSDVVYQQGKPVDLTAA
jgi:hypothetical protein